MQARIVLPESVKTGPKPEFDQRSEKKPETGFLSFVMQAVARQPASLETSAPPAAPERAENPLASGQSASRAADAASEAARVDERAERIDREVQETRDKHQSSRTEDRSAEESRAAAAARASQDAAQASRADQKPLLDPKPEPRTRTVQTRLHAAFDLRPAAVSQDRIETLFGKVQKRESLSLQRPLSAQMPEKITQADKSLLAERAEGVRPSRNVQTKRIEEQQRAALEMRPEVREPVRKQETKERTVAVSVNPEKWTIEHEKRDFKDFRGSAQGERRELVREIRESKARLHTPVESRETGFAELLKSSSLPVEQKKVLSEVKETFSKLVERARVNIGADGSSSASMRLKPEQLGNVTLNLRVTGSQVEAKLVVESEHVKKMMKEDIEQLAVELKRQGFSVDAIEIRVREPSEQGTLSFSPDQNARNTDPRSASGAPGFQPLIALNEEYEYGAEAAEPVWEGSVNLAV